MVWRSGQWEVRLDGAEARAGRGAGVASGSTLGEGAQGSGKCATMGNVGLERMGVIFRWRSRCVRGSLFPTLIGNKIVDSIFFSFARDMTAKMLSVSRG